MSVGQRCDLTCGQGLHLRNSQLINLRCSDGRHLGGAHRAHACSAQGLNLTILRPSVIFGKDDAFINLFAKLQKVFPLMPLAGAHTRFQPVSVQDVARALMATLDNPRTAGQVYELGGPEVLTLAQLVQHAGRWAGCERPIFPLPYAVAYLQALAMEWAPGEPLMSRDNLASMQTDNVLSGGLPGLAELGLGRGESLRTAFPLT